MRGLVVLVLALAACGVTAAPGNLLAAPLAYAAPAPLVTAHSSQVVAQRFHGVAAPLVAPAPLAYAAPFHVAAPAAAYLLK
ncbi:cuticle protein 38-like [Bacillus rossius redtenbacheri]|uniref:cuticle protein 38-like n=1 Tax=Bacillus rossius redtenbacheri TaxID=93214 RepID=UPI002FDEA148